MCEKRIIHLIKKKNNSNKLNCLNVPIRQSIFQQVNARLRSIATHATGKNVKIVFPDQNVSGEIIKRNVLTGVQLRVTLCNIFQCNARRQLFGGGVHFGRLSIPVKLVRFTLFHFVVSFIYFARVLYVSIQYAATAF